MVFSWGFIEYLNIFYGVNMTCGRLGVRTGVLIYYTYCSIDSHEVLIRFI